MQYWRMIKQELRPMSPLNLDYGGYDDFFDAWKYDTGRRLTGMERDAIYYGLDLDQKVRFFNKVSQAQTLWQIRRSTRRNELRYRRDTVVLISLVVILSIVGLITGVVRL